MATNRGLPSPSQLTRAAKVWLVVSVLTIVAIALLVGFAMLSAAYLPPIAVYIVIIMTGVAFAVGIGAIVRWLVPQ